jgi:hypothetical protein
MNAPPPLKAGSPTHAPLPQFPPHSRLAEPDLLFHPDRKEDRSPHPLLGLIEFGPYSRSTVHTVLDPIRVAVIIPHGGLPDMDRLFSEFSQKHWPKERTNYLPEYQGFSRVFGVNIVRANVVFEFPQDFNDQVQSSPTPHVLLAEAMARALSMIEAKRNDFDVVAVYLPNRWERGFFGPEGDDFDLHDYIKAIAAVRAIPTQVINDDSALSYRCRCSVMWRLSIALYTKVGGVPWKLAETETETAYIGLSYALRPTESNAPRYVTCCSQVFDADGAGLEFVAYDTADIHVERDNPFLSRADMRRVMARSLTLYQRRHTGAAPKKIVVHKSTEFKPEEVEGCFDALRVADVELIQVQQDSGWRGVLIEPPRARQATKGAPAAYPCERGLFLPLDGRNVLLWTQGNAPRAALDRKNFYKEGKGIPEPLQLKRFAGHGPWNPTCEAVLSLSKMNWNNDSLYDRLPVTMAYAQILARVIKRMPRLLSDTYQFRFFM